MSNEYESVVNNKNSDEIICTICGDKACDNCGASDGIYFPQPIQELVNYIMEWSKPHYECKETLI